MAVQQAFVEEIDFNELEFIEIVGRGAFGVVSRARWRSVDVAVKLIETESEKKAFITELKQLSRVNHVNIVKLYGACTKQPVCLVMEYAEGGSLYNVLHGSGTIPSFSAGHAISWCLQCARGVEYLHGMKPKPLVHRDLKPPNLLLINRGTVLKICDFGTACDAHTHMTNNKGSAAWMAPEVFEGNNYSEKCDVFSWGIILWEVITRRKPFDEIGGPAFRIMWAVHNGTRPPLIKNCPKPLELLMTRCWSSNPCDRPSMAEVSRIMTHLFQFFGGGDEPLQYPTNDPNQTPKLNDTPMSTYDNPQYSGGNLTRDSRSSTMQDTMHQAANALGQPLPRPAQPQPINLAVQEDNSRTSAPASLQASRENLLEYRRSSGAANPALIDRNKRLSADLSNLRLTDPQQMSKVGSSEPEVKPIPPDIPPLEFGDSVYPISFPYVAAQQYLQPLPPCPTCPESVAIYQQHRQLSVEYLRIQAEIALLLQRRTELLNECQLDETERINSKKLNDDYEKLLNENDALKLLQGNLKKQLAQIKQQQQQSNQRPGRL